MAAVWSAHEAVWADPDLPEDQKMMDGVVALFGTPALARLADLLAMTQEWRPDIVVHEVLESAGPMLAARLEVPAIVHGIGPMFPFYAHLIGAAGAAIGEPGCGAAVRAGPGHLPALPAARPTAHRPGPRHAVRPSAGEPGGWSQRVADVLATDEPVAYFTLGTVKNAETADFRTGLTALAEYDGVVIATTGRPPRPRGARSLPANVVVAEFVPQAALLERADLLVSHSGSGTMLGGLVHGVPQVALPRGTDQPQNAALLERAGAGVVVHPEDYAVDTIQAAVREVTGDPSFRAAAERVRDEIAAMPDADAVWAGLPF